MKLYEFAVELEKVLRAIRDDGEDTMNAAVNLAHALVAALPARPPEDARGAALTVGLVDGRLVISIGVDTLAFAVANSPDYEGDPIKIVDPTKAAEEIVRELEHEEEDGTTPVHKLLDKAAFSAWENGGEGFFIEGEDDRPPAPPAPPAVGDAG